MIKQVLFAIALVLTLAVFSYTVARLSARFRLTCKAFPIRNIFRRLLLTIKVAFVQTRILRRPVVGLMHALVFWGFCVILFGSMEMVIDGLTAGEGSFRALGILYRVFIASGDIFAILILFLILAFLGRRSLLKIKRFHGPELTRRNHLDAAVALSLIFFLMVSLLGMNTFTCKLNEISGQAETAWFPVSSRLAGLFPELTPGQLHTGHEINWWIHILLIFIFANYLPYSKHFHVFLSIPNVFLSNFEPLGKLKTLEHVTAEVRLMMDPQTAFAAPASTSVVRRFGVLDIEDITWKNYLDSLSCTQCGRCTSVCPANLTGKKLSPRKIMMDVRARMKEKAPGLIRQGPGFSDNKSLLRDYVAVEELWACTTCNACARECPVNINQPSLIVDMRRFLVMEESAAPAGLNAVFANIGNNGAPWQFSMQDRMKWADGANLKVPLISELNAQGRKPEYLLWIGSTGAFDDRYKRVIRSFVRILNYLDIDFGVLGTEESSSGDVARRAGNEMLFQMQALMNIGLLNNYGVTRILTCDPHAYNTFKNEYPDLGGTFEVIHHSRFLESLIRSGTLKPDPEVFRDQVLTYHDPCYLGRANREYSAPRSVIRALAGGFREMDRNRSFALCCGAGGGQMFKEAEKGDREVFQLRTDDALKTGADIIVTACPYCLVMMTDGIKYNNREGDVKALDLAEITARSLHL